MCRNEYSRSIFGVALAITLVMSLAGQCYGQLRNGFYNGKCTTNKNMISDIMGQPKRDIIDVENQVKRLVQAAMQAREIDAAALLRMQFHDCFVKGCDASILINGTSSEKTAPPNFSVRGYEFIDKVKLDLESKCPNVVSCADIIIMATKEAVSNATGGKINYNVKTGRRDGTESLASNVNLPSSTISVNDSVKAFQDKGFTRHEMVLLIGGHTIGKTHCNFIKDRLYNFNNVKGSSDPKMQSQLRDELKVTCPQNLGGQNISVDLDQGFPKNTIDEKFLGQLKIGRGVLQIDNDLAFDPLTKPTVDRFSNSFDDFATGFGNAMVKLGELDVLTGKKGQIRSSCAHIR